MEIVAGGGDGGDGGGDGGMEMGDGMGDGMKEMMEKKETLGMEEEIKVGGCNTGVGSWSCSDGSSYNIGGGRLGSSMCKDSVARGRAYRSMVVDCYARVDYSAPTNCYARAYCSAITYCYAKANYVWAYASPQGGD